MKIKFSAKYKGRCSVCKKEEITVFKIGDEESKHAAVICEDCVTKGEITDPEDFVKRFGEKDDESFTEGVKYHRKSVAG